jgi:uncharacterized protein with von Willebrand factor type A (vWA) domain
VTFDPTAFHKQYQRLNELPDSLCAEVVTHSSGKLPDRIAAVLAMRAALLAGRLPDAAALPWPAPDGARALLGVLKELDLPRYCVGHEELVDAVILSFLRAIDCHNEELQSALIRLRAEMDAPAPEDPSDPRKPPGGAAERARLLKQIQPKAAECAAAAATASLRSEWADRIAAWAQIFEVFGSLGNLLGRGWDLGHAALRHVAWQDVAKAHELLKGAPRLRDVVRTLGRLNDAGDGEATVAERIFEPVRRVAEEWRDVRSPLVPSETRGVERSAELSRMLPGEVVMLGHPRLRMLWYARFAERALLTYRVEGVAAERVIEETEGQGLREKAVLRARGPILVCIDTSGSMHGAPENVAKAIALEAMRVAHAEGRACHAYAFSGPQDVVEHTLSLTQDGLATLLAFLGQSFGGGTDISEPVKRAAEKLAETGWERADLLLVTDGEFGVPEDSIRHVEDARSRHGLRVHGILVGGRGHKWALQRLCDHVHVFERADLAVAETPQDPPKDEPPKWEYGFATGR